MIKDHTSCFFTIPHFTNVWITSTPHLPFKMNIIEVTLIAI
jgi:hypothetical protein